MPKTLPYRITTATGETIDFSFPLHPETLSAVRVSGLLTALLATLDREIKVSGETGNGDVLQALAMALAARAAMIAAPSAQTAKLAGDLLQTALAAAIDAPRDQPVSGRA